MEREAASSCADAPDRTSGLHHPATRRSAGHLTETDAEPGPPAGPSACLESHVSADDPHLPRPPPGGDQVGLEAAVGLEQLDDHEFPDQPIPEKESHPRRWGPPRRVTTWSCRASTSRLMFEHANPIPAFPPGTLRAPGQRLHELGRADGHHANRQARARCRLGKVGAAIELRIGLDLLPARRTRSFARTAPPPSATSSSVAGGRGGRGRRCSSRGPAGPRRYLARSRLPCPPGRPRWRPRRVRAGGWPGWQTASCWLAGALQYRHFAGL